MSHCETCTCAEESESTDGYPDWLLELSTIQGYGWTLARAEDWLAQQRIPEEMATKVVTALRAKWGGPKWKYVNPEATFRNWCLIEKERGNGNGAVKKGGYSWAWEGRR